MKKFDIVYYEFTPHIITGIAKNSISIAGINKTYNGSYAYEINVTPQEIIPYRYSQCIDFYILKLRDYIKKYNTIFGFVEQEYSLKAFA